jgi:hypothetical protein
MTTRIERGESALAAASRRAEFRIHLRTQDSTVSRIFGRRQKPGKLCAPFPPRLRGQSPLRRRYPPPMEPAFAL